MGNSRWKNWSGRVSCAPDQIFAPRDEAELAAFVRTCAAKGLIVRPVGSGHSFTDLVKTSGAIISLDRLTGLIEVDKPNRTATVWAGTKLWQICEQLDPFGLAMENLGDINQQSIAGAISTGTHGTGLQFGSLSTQVVELALLTASGETVECSETRNADIFKAAQVSMGALGIITRATLRLVPSFRLKYVRKRANFAESLVRSHEYARDNRHFELFLFPHTETVLLKLHNETDGPIQYSRAGRWLREVFNENVMFGAMARYCRAKPARCPRMSQLTARRVGECEEVDVGHKVLCTRRMVRFNEMEYSVPLERGASALRELKEWIVRANVLTPFPIEYRYVKADDIWLSPFYGRDSVTISVHQYKGMKYDEYFEGAERIFRKHDGRPHWGKLHGLGRGELRERYPKWDEFQQVRAQLDPKGVFLNPYLAKVLGTGT